jgi:hypothetical protein
MPKFDPKAEQPQYELLKGTYPFEIIGVQQLTSAGAKTNGYLERRVKLQFYKDTSFKEKLANFEDSLYDHPDTDWKFSVLAKCVGMQVAAGEAFDIDDTWKGYRGFAECEPQAGLKDKTKFYNRVKRYLTDQPALPPNKTEDPFAE